MANTQRRTVPSPTDLNYAFLMENIHTADLEDEMSRWANPPHLKLSIGTQNPLVGSYIDKVEPLNPALEPSPVNNMIYTRAILPSALRPSNNTPPFIPPTFPPFPPKYTYAFTPTYPPRAVDPETIRKRAVAERDLVEQSLARLVASEQRESTKDPRNVPVDGREKREQVWWETWREMGCDLDKTPYEVWPVGKMRR